MNTAEENYHNAEVAMEEAARTLAQAVRQFDEAGTWFRMARGYRDAGPRSQEAVEYSINLSNAHREITRHTDNRNVG